MDSYFYTKNIWKMKIQCKTGIKINYISRYKVYLYDIICLIRNFKVIKIRTKVVCLT